MANADAFDRLVADRLKESGCKVAYLMVDALRYELGVALEKLLSEDGPVQLQAAYAQLPTITLVGMASLLSLRSLDVVADRGYFSSEEILACEKAGITVTLPKPMTSNSKAEGRFGKQDFRYVAEEDVYICPAGVGGEKSWPKRTSSWLRQLPKNEQLPRGAGQTVSFAAGST